MKKLIAIALMLVLCLSMASTAFAYAYSGTLAKNGIATTRHQKKDGTEFAPITVANKSKWNARLGYHMWFKSRTNYVTFQTVVTDLKEFNLVYEAGHGLDGELYGLAVKNHKNNDYKVTVSGTWQP